LRGALLSALGGFFDGERMLDVCAGTGAMALEFLSRGCGHAVAIEQDETALGILRRNAQHTRLADKLEVIAQDARKALAHLGREGRQFEYIFVDPPYDNDLYAPLLQAIVLNGLLAPASQVIVETRSGLDPALLAGWTVVASRRYGSSTLQRLTREVE
jgi:16S rRNA (guanine966-N2)-methyltransferase